MDPEIAKIRYYFNCYKEMFARCDPQGTKEELCAAFETFRKMHPGATAKEFLDPFNFRGEEDFWRKLAKDQFQHEAIRAGLPLLP